MVMPTRRYPFTTCLYKSSDFQGRWGGVSGVSEFFGGMNGLEANLYISILLVSGCRRGFYGTRTPFLGGGGGGDMP